MGKKRRATAKGSAHHQPAPRTVNRRWNTSALLALGMSAAAGAAWQHLRPITLRFDRQLQQSEDWECKQACTKAQLYGNKSFTYNPSRGFYPAACRWREVQFEDDSQAVAYEYWQPRGRRWSTERPTDCTLMTQVSIDSICIHHTDDRCKLCCIQAVTHCVQLTSRPVRADPVNQACVHCKRVQCAVMTCRPINCLHIILSSMLACYACRPKLCRKGMCGTSQSLRSPMALQPRPSFPRTRTC